MAPPRTDRARRSGREAEARIETEDALKHLYKAEYRGLTATADSLAGALQIGRARASELLTELRTAGLTTGADPVRLSDEGRSYALRIIRTHRLWERYLADRTGVAPGDWHAQAEEREHFLSPDEVDVLAARLGHPRFDPHGDPIPTASGDLPAASGVPLTHLDPGDFAVVTHLEDEPAEFYDRLLGAGLAPQTTLRVVEGPIDSLTFEVTGEIRRLDLASAANVTVRIVDPESVSTGDRPPLVDLADGASVEIESISPACQGIQRRRLLDLGLVPGTVVTAELSAAGGDPRAFMVRGALVALRKDQQAWVRTRVPVSSEAKA